MEVDTLNYYNEILITQHHYVYSCSTLFLVLVVGFFLYMTIGVCLAQHKRYIGKNIGKLEEICMYDFYSGEPRPKTSATTTESLISSFQHDRKYLMYIPRNDNQAHNQIVLDKPEFFSLKPYVLFRDDNVNRWLNSTRDTVYFPDGSHIYMYDCGEEFAKYFTNAYGAGNIQYRLGVQTNYDKILSRDHYRLSTTNSNIDTKMGLSPRHATCTLVNTQSVLDVELSITMPENAKQLSHYNFRPHLVIRAPKYEEDKIKGLRIGTAEFTNPLPCLIDEKVNYNSVLRVLSTDNQPYLFLKQKRKLKDVCPAISMISNKPVFGISLVVSKHGEFKVNDPVYAQY